MPEESRHAVCGTCRHWNGDAEIGMGQCRRHTPVLRTPLQPLNFSHTTVVVNNRWPEVSRDEWCGEWEPKTRRLPGKPITPVIVSPDDLPSFSEFVRALNVRGRKAFLRLRIDNWSSLLNINADVLLETRNFGFASMADLVATMNRFGVSIPKHWGEPWAV